MFPAEIAEDREDEFGFGLASDGCGICSRCDQCDRTARRRLRPARRRGDGMVHSSDAVFEEVSREQPAAQHRRTPSSPVCTVRRGKLPDKMVKVTEMAQKQRQRRMGRTPEKPTLTLKGTRLRLTASDHPKIAMSACYGASMIRFAIFLAIGSGGNRPCSHALAGMRNATGRAILLEVEICCRFAVFWQTSDLSPQSPVSIAPSRWRSFDQTRCGCPAASRRVWQVTRSARCP